MQVLRTVFFLTVLGNLLLFAYANGYLSRSGDGEPDRLASQIEPGSIRIVSRGVAPVAGEPPAEGCRAFSGLTEAQAQALADLLRGRDPKLGVGMRPVEMPTSWWVYLPPQKNRREADKKAAELKKLGLEDFLVVQESGPNQFAVSLGLYKSEQGARERLAAVQGKGARSARIQVRESPTDKMLVEVRGPLERFARALADLPADLDAPTPADCGTARQTR